jgi:hypothetical protein
MRNVLITMAALVVVGCSQPAEPPPASHQKALDEERQKTEQERSARVAAESRMQAAEDRAQSLKTMLLLAALGAGGTLIVGIGIGSAARKRSALTE